MPKFEQVNDKPRKPQMLHTPHINMLAASDLYRIWINLLREIALKVQKFFPVYVAFVVNCDSAGTFIFMDQIHDGPNIKEKTILTVDIQKKDYEVPFKVRAHYVSSYVRGKENTEDIEGKIFQILDQYYGTPKNEDLEINEEVL